MSAELERLLVLTGAMCWTAFLVLIALAAVCVLRERHQAGLARLERLREREAMLKRQEAAATRVLYPVPDLEIRATRNEKKRAPLALVSDSGALTHHFDGGSDGSGNAA